MISSLPPPLPIAPVASDVTRREFVAMLAAAGLLAACGGDGDESVAGPDSAGVTSRIESVLGPIDVPADPQRVVAIEGRDDLDYSLALGLPIVGYPSNDRFGDDRVSPFLAEALAAHEQAEALFSRGEPNFESIAAARPDLIVARVVEAENFATQLGAIAPVLPVPFDQPWQQVSRLFAEGFGRIDRHRELVDRYVDSLERIRAEHPGVLDARVAAFQVDLDGVYVDGRDSFKGQVLQDLGASFAPITDEVDPVDGLTLSAEQIDRVFEGVDGFILVVNTPEEVAALEANALWANQALVRDGRFVTTTFFSNGGGPLTAIGVAQLIASLYSLLDA